MRILPFRVVNILLVITTCFNANAAFSEVLSLQQAIAKAQQNDPWIQQSHHQQAALNAQAISSSTLPDPKVTIAMANLPTDSWEFNQEPMTQFKVGVSQMFPRGDQLKLKQQQLQIMSEEWPYLRADRMAQVRQMVSRLWLEGYRAYHSIRLIEKNRFLFEQMVAITQSNYGSGMGRTRQQDVVRAQLELTRLEDRLAQLHQQQEVNTQQLLEWLQNSELGAVSHSLLQWPEPLPQLKQEYSLPGGIGENEQLQWLAQYFSLHPRIKAFDQKIQASLSAKDLAQQKYKPEWGLNASYGYRDDDPMGNDRADFFSVGVSFDVPLFTGNRQDQEVVSAIEKSEAIKTQKWQALRKMIADYQSAIKKVERLQQRQTIYRKSLLPQMQEQAEASLTAYTNDDGDFAEVMRARIAQLNSEIEMLAIDVEHQKTLAQIQYFQTQMQDKGNHNE